MTSDELDRSDELAEQALSFLNDLADFLSARGTKTALIGAMALAVHGYVRGTADWDCGVSTTKPQQLFASIEAWLDDDYDIECRLPDYDDPLGGVAIITGPNGLEIELVNFTNPLSLKRSPGKDAIDEAEYNKSLGFPVVNPEHLFVLKLYGGSLRDLADAAELVRNLPRAIDWNVITALAERYRLTDRLETVRDELDFKDR